MRFVIEIEDVDYILDPQTKVYLKDKEGEFTIYQAYITNKELPGFNSIEYIVADTRGSFIKIKHYDIAEVIYE